MKAHLVLLVVALFSLMFVSALITIRADAVSVISNGEYENGLGGWAGQIVGSPTLDVNSEHVHSGNFSLHISSSLSDLADVYQFIDYPSRTYVFSFWIYRTTDKSESFVELIQKHPWVDGAGWSPVASLFVLSNDKVQVDAWDTANPPSPTILDYSISAGTWHKIMFVADRASMTQEIYVDDALLATLNSSSGTTFIPEVIVLGDISTSDCYGTFYFDDVELKSTLTADINGDGTVDILDAILLANAYGTTPGMPNWNPRADLNGDNLVDIFDAITLAANFGNTA